MIPMSLGSPCRARSASTLTSTASGFSSGLMGDSRKYVSSNRHPTFFSSASLSPVPSHRDSSACSALHAVRIHVVQLLETGLLALPAGLVPEFQHCVDAAADVQRRRIWVYAGRRTYRKKNLSRHCAHVERREADTFAISSSMLRASASCSSRRGWRRRS
jgi:hypothetical protein